MQSTPNAILVVDDYDASRDVLADLLELEGHQVTVAKNGRQALELINAMSFDLILLDIMMPEMNGVDVLKEIRKKKHMREVPVVMISALTDEDSIVECINLGAADYIPKPFNNVILRARINASLERKLRYDIEQAYLTQLERAQEQSERLLLNVLPDPIAKRLKKGERTIADQFDEATVLFVDIVDFTQYSTSLSPLKLVKELNQVFSVFDRLVQKYGLEKIKTIGDAYMVVGGVPIPRNDHAVTIANLALDLQQAVLNIDRSTGDPLQVRIGINTGPVVAGIIGRNKFSYDLWGDTVNIASRMESTGLPNQIQVSAATYELLKGSFTFEARGPVQVKGRGKMMTYLLTGRCKPRNRPLATPQFMQAVK